MYIYCRYICSAYLTVTVLCVLLSYSPLLSLSLSAMCTHSFPQRHNANYGISRVTVTGAPCTLLTNCHILCDTTPRRTPLVAQVFRSYPFVCTSSIIIYILPVPRTLPVVLIFLLGTHGWTGHNILAAPFVALHPSRHSSTPCHALLTIL